METGSSVHVGKMSNQCDDLWIYVLDSPIYPHPTTLYSGVGPSKKGLLSKREPPVEDTFDKSPTKHRAYGLTWVVPDDLRGHFNGTRPPVLTGQAL